MKVSNVYFSLDDLILIHQSRVKACPHYPPGGLLVWGRRHDLGKPPQWVEDLLRDPDRSSEQYAQDAALTDSDGPPDQHTEDATSPGTDGSSEQHMERAAPPHFDGLSEQHMEDFVLQDSYGSSERNTKDITLPNVSPPCNLQRDPRPSLKAQETQARD